MVSLHMVTLPWFQNRPFIYASTFLIPLFCILSFSLHLVFSSCTYTEQREVLLCRLFKMLLDPLFPLSRSLRVSAAQISLLIKLSIVLICWARGIC